MRIIIDLQGCQNGSRHRGIGRYTFALAKAIIRNSPQHEVLLLLNGLFPEEVESIQEHFKGLLPPHQIVVFQSPAPVSALVPENAWRRQAAELIREWMIARLEPEAVIVSSMIEGGTDNTVTSCGWINGVPVRSAVLYDLIPLLDPERYIGWPPATKWYMDKVGALARCDLLLAISESSRLEAINHLAVAPSSVVNISTAADEAFIHGEVSQESLLRVRNKYGIRRHYLMHTGAIEARKNFMGLIEAFGLLPATLRHRHQLVLVGKHTAEDLNQLQLSASRAGLEADALVVAGHVNDDELRALYSGCHLFVFPSLHEGFGLPALEAMHFGVPTIGSSTTSIPEVIGRADATFDPTSGVAIAALIQRCLTDASFYSELRSHARRQAARFDWNQIARVATQALESAWAAKGRPAFKAPIAEPDLESWVMGQLVSLPDAPAPNDDDLLQAARSIAANELAVAHFHARSQSLTWRIEGPFDSSYSLAIVNRECARALAQMGHRVVLHSTEGPGDFAANPAFLAANPDLAAMHALVDEYPEECCDVVSRNLYPPRVADMHAGMNLLHPYGWEETGFPPDWIDQFNQHLNGVTCLSEHVRKVLEDNGLRVPAVSVGTGVDHWERITATAGLKFPGKGFRFLHVSSCFPRKGVDVLIAAYGQAFTREDDVTLLIKTFKNPHNEVHRQIDEAKRIQANYPDVQVIEDDLPDDALKALYQHCQVLVAPSRAEGFGLPLAEAMLSGLPVITTAWGGQLDFCNDDNAWLVDYQFAPAKSHFNVPGSAWADPNIDSLADAMRRAGSCSPEERRRRAARGREVLLAHFRWSDVSSRALEAVRAWEQATHNPRAPRVAWITTWNTKCGIASYSRHLIEAGAAADYVLAPKQGNLVRDDEDFVHRCWYSAKSDNALEDLSEAIGNLKSQVLIIQFNYGFFEFQVFDKFLQEQADAGRTIIVMMHSTGDPAQWAEHDPNWRLSTLTNGLARCARVLVHSFSDLNRLKSIGLTHNVALYPHPLWRIEAARTPGNAVPTTAQPPLISTFGYCLPHKGLSELISAIGILKRRGKKFRLQLLNAEYPDPTSQKLVSQLRAQIQKEQLTSLVTLVSEYQTESEAARLMMLADLLVFPYQDTQESASGAIRHGMATGRPVLVTPVPIFDEVGEAVHRALGTSPEQLAKAIERYFDLRDGSDPIMAHHEKAAKDWREALDVRRLAARLTSLILSCARGGRSTLADG